MNKKHNKSNFKIGQVQVKYTRKKMTACGGFSLIAKFFENIRLAEAIKQIIPVTEKSPNSMGIYPKMLSLFLTTLAGGRKFSHLLFLDSGIDIFNKVFIYRRRHSLWV